MQFSRFLLGALLIFGSTAHAAKGAPAPTGSPTASPAPTPRPKHEGVCRSGVQIFPKNFGGAQAKGETCQSQEVQECLIQAADSCVRGFTQGEIHELSGALYPATCSGWAYYSNSLNPTDIRACCTFKWTCDEMLPGTFPEPTPAKPSSPR